MKAKILRFETIDGIISIDDAQIINPQNYMIEIKWHFSVFDSDHEKLDKIIKSQLCVGRDFERTDDYIIFSYPICGIREIKFCN